MSKSNFHSFALKQREGTDVLTGANAMLFLDGKPLLGVRSFDLSLKAGGIAEITIGLVGKVEIEGNFESSFVKGLEEINERRD